jgi:hypothetical protein
MKSILLVVFLCVSGVAMADVTANNPTGQWDQGQKFGDPTPTPCYGPAGSC